MGRKRREWDSEFEARSYDREYYDKSAQYYDRAMPAFTRWLASFEPTSIADVGCGTGAFIAPFAGRIPVIGIDISVDAGHLLPSACFLRFDLTQPFPPSLMADLVLSLEVYEHIPAEHEDQFLDNIVGFLPRLVVLSCAKPGQWGRHHCNCQTAEHVAEQMAKRGYAHDPEATKPLLTMKYLATFYRRNTQVYRRAE